MQHRIMILKEYLHDSEINQYGYLVHEVKMCMAMILNDKMWKTANYKTTGIATLWILRKC